MKTIFSLPALVVLLDLSFGLRSDAATIELSDQHGHLLSDAIITVSGSPQVDTSALVVVDQVDKRFVPLVSYAHKGQRVHFPNSDDVRHHVYSFSKAKRFELKLYSGSTSEPLLFDTAGLVVLGCNIHDRMIGYIYIAEDEFVAKTNAQGRAELDVDAATLNEPNNKITVWHPRLGLTPDIKADYVLPPPSPDGVYTLQITLARDKKEEKKNRFRSGFY